MEVKEQPERKIAKLHSRILQLESHNNRLAEENEQLQQVAANPPAAVSSSLQRLLWAGNMHGSDPHRDATLHMGLDGEAGSVQAGCFTGAMVMPGRLWHAGWS